MTFDWDPPQIVPDTVDLKYIEGRIVLFGQRAIDEEAFNRGELPYAKRSSQRGFSTAEQSSDEDL